jgi:hypothetical protein
MNPAFPANVGGHFAGNLLTGDAISRDVWLSFSGRFSPNLMTPGFSTLVVNH